MAAPGRWDEACFSVPAVRALGASGLRIGILCNDAQTGFWQTAAQSMVVGFSEKTLAKAVASAIGEWEAAIVWEPGFAAEVVRLAKPPRILGPQQVALKKILTHPLRSTQGPLEHRVRYYLSAVEELGLETRQSAFFAPAEVATDALSDAVLLCPDSDFGPSHEWPLERWAELARRLMENQQPLVIASLDTGRSLGRSLASRLGESAGFQPLSMVSSALPTLAKYPRMIAVDGTLPHLAAHVGVTCITLFGPNDPQWKRPLGRRHLVVRRHVECAPCLLARCPLDSRCQLELETSAILQAIAGHPAWTP